MRVCPRLGCDCGYETRYDHCVEKYKKVVIQKSKMEVNTYDGELQKGRIVNWKSLDALVVDDEARGWKML